jgi:Leucine-rich repeat (LRR) protein
LGESIKRQSLSLVAIFSANDANSAHIETIKGGLRPLDHTALTTLDLSHTQVSDLRPLAGLTHLKKLTLQRYYFTEGQLKKLQEMLPNCQIHD